MSVTKKAQTFLTEPLDERPVNIIPGIAKADMLKAFGYPKVTWSACELKLRF